MSLGFHLRLVGYILSCWCELPDYSGFCFLFNQFFISVDHYRSRIPALFLVVSHFPPICTGVVKGLTALSSLSGVLSLIWKETETRWQITNSYYSYSTSNHTQKQIQHINRPYFWWKWCQWCNRTRKNLQFLNHHQYWCCIWYQSIFFYYIIQV